MRVDLFAPKPLRDALIKAGVEDVRTERQVRRWISGDTPMPTRIRTAIRALLELPAETKEAAPDVPERLDAVLDYLRIIARVVKVPPELLADLESAHRDAAGVVPERQQSDAARRKADRRPRGR